ncbi:MAG: hypothetical protein COC22_00380, partial [Flavobacteriaceae bacterium]
FYNKKRKSIILKESKILYTKSKEIEDVFCFININGKIKLKDNKNSIRGSFIGLYKNKDTCSTGGKILLMSVKDAFNKFKKVAKKVSKLKRIDSITKEKFNTTRFLNEIKPNTLKSNEVLTVFWNSNKIILDVWDNGKEDGDLITIKFNNKTVLYKYEVKHKKKRLEFLLQEGKNIFNIIANNNGSIFPNTAKALLKDGKINYVISSNLEAGQTSKINIVYKKIKD